MAEVHSPYYPPRAKGWRRWIVNPLHPVRRKLRLTARSKTIIAPLWRLAAAFVIPGLAFRWAKAPTLARFFWPAYLGCGLVALAALGFTAGSVAFGLMLSLHATGFLVYTAHLWHHGNLPKRILLGTGVLVSLTMILYRPLGGLLNEHFFLPLRTPQGVVIVNRMAHTLTFQRGDVVAYRLQAHGGIASNIRVVEGFGVEIILGLPGDRLVFGKEAVEVNGVAHPRRPDMPVAGEFVVPEKHWFIWPAVATHGNRAVAEQTIAAAKMNLAVVEQSDFVGKPFQRWFGRRQSLP